MCVQDIVSKLFFISGISVVKHNIVKRNVYKKKFLVVFCRLPYTLLNTCFNTNNNNNHKYHMYITDNRYETDIMTTVILFFTSKQTVPSQSADMTFTRIFVIYFKTG